MKCRNQSLRQLSDLTEWFRRLLSQRSRRFYFSCLINQHYIHNKIWWKSDIWLSCDKYELILNVMAATFSHCVASLLLLTTSVNIWELRRPAAGPLGEERCPICLIWAGLLMYTPFTNIPPCHRRCREFNWEPITSWMVSLQISIHQPTEQFSTLPQSLSNELWSREDGCHVHIWLLLCIIEL